MLHNVLFSNSSVVSGALALGRGGAGLLLWVEGLGWLPDGVILIRFISPVDVVPGARPGVDGPGEFVICGFWEEWLGGRVVGLLELSVDAVDDSACGVEDGEPVC